MNKFNPIYELLFVPNDVRLARRLSNRSYLDSKKQKLITKEHYVSWLEKQLRMLEVTHVIATQKGVKRFVVEIDSAKAVIEEELRRQRVGLS